MSMKKYLTRVNISVLISALIVMSALSLIIYSQPTCNDLVNQAIEKGDIETLRAISNNTKHCRPG